MPDNETSLLKDPTRAPWNKGKLIGAKPPLRPRHVWSIRTRLMLEGRTRDLAMFNLAIDSKLRGCDVAALKVEDVAPNGYTIDRATVRQRKTGRPVKFELTDLTRQAVDDFLRVADKKPGDFYSRATALLANAWRPGNRPGSSPNGSRTTVSIRAFMAPTRCGGRRQR